MLDIDWVKTIKEYYMMVDNIIIATIFLIPFIIVAVFTAIWFYINNFN